MTEGGTVQWLVPLGVLALSAAAAGAARMIHRRRPVRRDMPGLAPGVALFTSDRCPGCDPVRSRMAEVLGAGGFREIRWAESPELFSEHRIDRVPAAAAIDRDGAGLLWEGMPPLRLLRKWKSFVYLR